MLESESGIDTNRLALQASLVERDSLRYTPAGIPVINCVLHHLAAVREAGGVRQVEFTIAAMAAGHISGVIAGLSLGDVARFSGFLARKNRSAKSLVFHITECERDAGIASTSIQGK